MFLVLHNVLDYNPVIKQSLICLIIKLLNKIPVVAVISTFGGPLILNGIS